jgi:hypothetical protein
LSCPIRSDQRFSLQQYAVDHLAEVAIDLRCRNTADADALAHQPKIARFVLRLGRLVPVRGAIDLDRQLGGRAIE